MTRSKLFAAAICVMMSAAMGCTNDPDTEYQVNIQRFTDGTTITASPLSARAGETVSLDCNPAPGRIFYHWSVTAGTTTIIPADSMQQATTFTMPASDVMVRATFYQ